MKRTMTLLFPFLIFAVPLVSGQRQRTQAETARYGNPTSTGRVFQDTLYGVVKKISKDELVLEKTVQGVDQTLKLEPKTKFIRDRKRASLSDLKVGDQVYVDVKKDKKTGQMIAKRVVTGVAATALP